MRLVVASRDQTEDSSNVLFPEGVLVQLRSVGLHRVRRTGRVLEIVGRSHRPRCRTRGTGETAVVDGLRQHVRPVHVFDTVRVRRPRVPNHGPDV